MPNSKIIRTEDLTFVPDPDQIAKAVKYLDLGEGAGLPEVLAQVRTSFDYPSIPTRNQDWSAHFDGREEDGSGQAATKMGAIEALLERIDLV